MTRQEQMNLEAAIRSDLPLDQIVVMLRGFKERGSTQGEVYSFLSTMRDKSTDEEMDDRILEVADFVAGFCAPHMKVWEEAMSQ